GGGRGGAAAARVGRPPRRRRRQGPSGPDLHARGRHRLQLTPRARALPRGARRARQAGRRRRTSLSPTDPRPPRRHSRALSALPSPVLRRPLIAAAALTLAAPASQAAAQRYTASSPSKAVTAEVTLAARAPRIAIKREGRVVLRAELGRMPSG